jgi:hypothetical protein
MHIIHVIMLSAYAKSMCAVSVCVRAYTSDCMTWVVVCEYAAAHACERVSQEAVLPSSKRPSTTAALHY